MSSNKLVALALTSAAVLTCAGVAVAQNQQQPQPRAAAKKTAMDGTIFHAQVLLDRAGFGPGVIDGKKGMSFEESIRGFQEARGLKESGTLDTPTRQALLRDKAPSTRVLSVSAEDARGPFTQIPEAPRDQAKLEYMGYRNLLEKLAEKFHTTPRTIIALNPGVSRLAVGTKLRLPNVLPSSRAYRDVKPDAAQLLSDLNISADQPKAERVVVDKSDGVLRVYGANDKLIAQFPATMGSAANPLPLGKWKIQGISYNPDFRFDPDLLTETAKQSEGKHLLKPGPNNPVGVLWHDLDKEHYGIHGTPTPETIGRAASNGCVRLTNWDAARLSLMVGVGTPAVFQA